ncbi:uncharacterized protein LOC129912178 [Episyrphus balteatus]|uniref:uncharacterized protein LOC129912178 n=1 Tax=Episyrphus balteatus TaxID=286459 RepID=UPI002486860E|nr:uncharacterized protein LOC129912178 [Episyrphus balteatus]
MTATYKFVTLLGLLAIAIGRTESSNILGVFTSSSPSHQIVHLSYVRALIERGHNVTVVTTIPLKDKNPKYHHILIPPSEARTKQMDDMKALMNNKNQSGLEAFKTGINSVFALGEIQTDALKDERFQDFMHNPGNKFDLLIVGYFFNDFHVGLGAHFKCPIIISWAGASYDMVDKFIGNPAEIAYVPASTMFGIPDWTKFTGRLSNFFTKITSIIFGALIDNQMASLYNEIFPPTDYPAFEEAKKKVSLVLLNYHFTDGIIRPNVPATIECGGIQIKEKPNPLPEDLQKIFNASSEHGVIYLSFGTNIKGDDLNPELFGILFKALSSLKQTVLWKWDGKNVPGNSPNIHYRKWLPQDDLLAHPNVKLFITHAGKGGTAESQFHGVPMVAVPFFADQLGNAELMVSSGFGLKVDQKTMTVDILKDSIKEVLENPKYRENVKEFSKLYRDRPMSAKETAIFWIEYVIRHKGAYHMQSPAVHLNAFQLVSADVIGFILLVIFLVYKSISIPTRFIWRKVFAKKSTKNTKNQKTKTQCFLALLIGQIESANILGVFTSSSPSHQIVHVSYAKALAERGHNVTVVTTIPLKDKNPKYLHILITPSDAANKIIDAMKAKASEKPGGLIDSAKTALDNLLALGSIQADSLKDERFQDFMNNPDNKFDLLIVGYFLNDFHVGLGAHFKCPVVLSWAGAPLDMLNRYVGNPAEIAYVQAINVYAYLFSELFPPSDYPAFEEAKKKVSLVLLNYHFTDGSIRPNVPATIECGGIQIKDKPDPLSEDLQKIFNASSQHGVIYLSFGSNIKGDDMNPELFGILFKVLSSLKQTVLWKWDGKTVPGNSTNIHYRKWLPQDDILGQPNVKLFITHAGKGTESQFHGVPMVAIPFFGDQFSNADTVAQSGFGLKIDQQTMTVESLKAALQDVLENPKYKKTVSQFSELYRDRPMSAKETAVYWMDPSHNIVHMAYIKALIERGHNVTVITALPLKDKNPKYHHILIPPTESRTKQLDEMKAKSSKTITIRDNIESVLSFGPMLADPLRDQRFQEFLQNPDNKFDLVVTGYFFNPFYVGLAAHFRCPMVISYATVPNSMVASFIGNPTEVAYVPVSPLFRLPDLTTFKGRLTNFMINIPVSIFTELLNYQMKGIYNELFPPSDYPAFEEAKKKVSLVVYNYHFTDGIIRPNVPAAIECGGIQIKDKADPLPANLEKLFNSSSEHGVVYVSFGSNLGIKEINPKVVNAMFKALSSLKQTVLWKWADSELPGTSPNIHYNSWLPQDDLLQHPNLKLFITHAGKGGVTEAAHHGVPMVAIPMVADQIGNADQVVKNEFGLKVDKATMTESSFKEAVLEVLNNPKYTENIKRFSILTKDRPMTAKQNAVFWLEYVIRHKGAYHMQSPAVHLNTLQIYSLDIIGFILLVLFIVYKLITVPAKFVLRKVFGKKHSKTKKLKEQ